VLGPRVLKKSLLAEVEFRLMNLESFVADRVSNRCWFWAQHCSGWEFTRLSLNGGSCCRCFDVSWI
jgi:hypothetical protein